MSRFVMGWNAQEEGKLVEKCLSIARYENFEW